MICDLGAQVIVVSCAKATQGEVVQIRDELLEEHAQKLLNTTLYCLKKLWLEVPPKPADIAEAWVKLVFVQNLEGVVNGYKPEKGMFLEYLNTCLKNFILEFPDRFPDKTEKLKDPWPTRRTKEGETIPVDLADLTTPETTMIISENETELNKRLQREENERRQQEEKDQAEQRQRKATERQRLRQEFAGHWEKLSSDQGIGYYLRRIEGISIKETVRRLSNFLGYEVYDNLVKVWVFRAERKLARLLAGGAP